MFAALLAILGPILGNAVSAALPDPIEAAKVNAQVQAALLENASKLEQAAANVILAEAAGESWLQRNWRPITMLTFVFLIVARWLGFAAPGMSEGEVLAAWNLMELGLGGYIIAKSAERTIPSIAAIIQNNRRQ